jgi:DNA-binding NtrC family response regulator
VQTKLLRVLQEKEIQPLGQNKTFKVDVRVVASTNRDLEAKIQSGEFREDLFYRLNVVSIVMPGLEELKEDIPLLVHHFLEKFKKQYEQFEFTPDQDTLKYLYDKKWPGNVRQLQNTIQRMVLLGGIDEHGDGKHHEPHVDTGKTAHHENMFEDLLQYDFKEAKAMAIQLFTEKYLERLLTDHNGNVTKAAVHCGLERQALQRTMRRYGIVSANYKK